MERIASCDLPMSKTGCAHVREILEICKGGPIRNPVPRQVPIAFKPGGITGWRPSGGWWMYLENSEFESEFSR